MTPTVSVSRGARSRGRPREFDLDQALDGAVKVFRERGYHATSVPHLAAAMNIAAGSLYKAFGDKHSVFLAALDHYAGGHAERRRELVLRPAPARERLRDILALYVEFSTGLEGRRGCLVVGGAIELAARDGEVDARVTGALAAIETLLIDLIGQGHADGSIPLDVEAQVTARVLICLLQGMRVVGRTGLQSARPETEIVDVALKLLV